MNCTLCNAGVFIKLMLLIITTLVSGLPLAGCSAKDDAIQVRLEKRDTSSRQIQTGAKPLRVAIGGMITPKDGFKYYRDFLVYIEEKMGRPVEFVDKDSYAEINDMLQSGTLDFAFVCSGPYVDGHDKFGLQLLVAPEVNGKPLYYSYIIVNAASPLNSFKSLKGKTFAFTDPLSNTGKLVPTYMLGKMKETPESFFKESIFTKKHDTSIRMVADKLVDGAAVDSLVWEYMNISNPSVTSRTKIIEKSPPYGIPPVVVPGTMSPETRKQLLKLFLEADRDEKGKVLLKGMMTGRFIEVDDHLYDSVRDMLAWTRKQKSK